MQSLGTLAGGIAHDFNNILTAIGGNTQLAVADLPPDHPALLSLAEIERASDRAAGLVRQILSFSRPQEANRKVVRLHTVVEEALRLLRASLPATIAIRTEFADETPDVAADSTQLHQVVMNLGANAAHAMGDRGGRLEFYLAPLIVEAANAAAFPALRDGCYAQLTVRDNGCGMDPSTLDRVFEPFFTTKPPGQGTGLGLSMVHGIIKGHSGVITVESEPERGTAFRIYFPAVESPATETTIAPSATLRGHGEHVLYVDDEETLVLLARRGLPRLGYRITAFTDARAALQHFRGHPADFDVVVTDLSMPGLSGLDLATEILRLRRDLPIILTTGYLRPQDATHAQALGLHDILPKPASHDTLAHALQRALQRR
jgi:CheY-like chemotaxis protein